jgi:DNA-binding FadR family transcriptional regulator
MISIERSRPENPVRAFLLAQASSGRMRIGDKLPTEREMASRFKCTRGAIRKVLAILEAEGAVVRRVGAGTFLAASNGGRPDASPAQVMQARLILEPELAATAVVQATAADLAYLDECLRKGKNARNLDEFEIADAEFHMAVAKATRNELLVRSLDLMEQARDMEEWRRLKASRHDARPARRADAQKEHEGIVAAIRRRDPTLARQLMASHLAAVRRNLLGT